MREQHGVLGGVPTVTLSNPLRRLAQTPNFKASLGHFPPEDGEGVGFGVGLGLGVGVGQVLHALAAVKNRMLITRKRAKSLVPFESISQELTNKQAKLASSRGNR